MTSAIDPAVPAADSDLLSAPVRANFAAAAAEITALQATTAANSADISALETAVAANTSGVAALDAFQAGVESTAGSGGVGHTAGGTGAVDTTVQAKIRTIVTDGDYSTAQQAATAALGKAYFVAAGATVTVTVPTDAADLQAAMTAIARWVIPASATVTISLPSGVTASTSPYSLQHPYGARIKIEGAAVVTTTATASGAVTGSSGAWAVPLTVASAAGISVGDYLLLRNVAGTGQYKLFSGMCKVSAIVGSTVTVTNTAKNAAWPTAALSAADITVLKTTLSFTGCDGLDIDGVVGSIDKVALAGNHTGGTVGLISQRAAQGAKAKGYVFLGQNVGISSFGDGGIYAQYGGTVDAAYICVADCLVYNVVGQHGGTVMANYGISTGCAQIGFAGSNSGDVSAEYSIAVGNGTYGYYTQSGGSLTNPYSYAWSNVSDGMRAAWGGSIRGQNVGAQYNGGAGAFAVGGFIVCPSSTCSNNSSSGLYAEGGANIYASSVTCSSNIGYGMYADGAVIDCPTSTASSNTINGATAVNNGTILVDQITGTGNGTYLCSANERGFVRATAAAGSGQTMYADTGGQVNATNATGTPTLTRGSGGVIVDTTGVIKFGAQAIASATVNGAVATSVFNSAKDSSYNSEGSASLVLQNITDPLKMLVAGYDNTRDYAYVQSLKSTSGYKNLAINPSGGNVSIGLGTTAPTARLHLTAGTATAGTAPFKLTAGTNLTAVENGAFEYDGTNLYFTTGGVRKTVTLT